MTADEFQEPVDCCKWRRLQRADGDWYNCKIEDCRNWACKYSTTTYVPSGPEDAENSGGGGTQSTTARPATTTTTSSRRKSSTGLRVPSSNAQRNTPAVEASASSRAPCGADDDLDPVVAAATAELDAMIANGTIPRTPPGFPYPYRRPSRAQSTKKGAKKEETK